MSLKLVAITKGVGDIDHMMAEEVVVYVARVSNPNNQTNMVTAAKLLKYLAENEHWSPFEHAYMTLEIPTSRGISAQILRHRSFVFQEFSQRYAAVNDSGIIVYPARRQDVKNRQNSIDDVSDEDKQWFENAQREVWRYAFERYQEALQRGIAKECARFMLPLNTSTKIYMTGNVRSWIHYIALRTKKSTQLEHRVHADEAKTIFAREFPSTAEALGWK